MKQKGLSPFYGGLTLVEVIMVMAVLAALTAGAWLTLSKFWQGRNVETVAENLVQLIRSAQLSAKETESVQVVLLAEEAAVWMKGEEIIRRQKFKNKVKITEIELKSGSVEVPDEPIAEAGIIIDEKGNAESATIVLSKGDERTTVSVGGSIVTAGGGTVGVLDSTVVAQFIEQVESGEDVLIVQTEPLQARGWQVIQVNNVDNVDTVSESTAGSSVQGKVKEVKLRVKLDSRLPTSAHIHAYVFPGWYENKPVAHGITGQQTMFYKKGTAPTYRRDSPHFLYREAAEDCMAFFNGTYTVSGTLMNEQEDPIAGMRVMCAVSPVFTNNEGVYSKEVSSNYQVAISPSSFYTLNGFTYWSKPGTRYFPPNTTGDQIANFILYRRIEVNSRFKVTGFIKENNGEPISDVRFYIYHVTLNYANYGITNEPDNFASNYMACRTQVNGFYSTEFYLVPDHSYNIIPQKAGYIFEPSSVTLFLNSDKVQDFIGTKNIPEGQFSANKPPLGNWGGTEAQMKNASIPVSVPVFGNALGYYIYKNKVENILNPILNHSATKETKMFNGLEGASGGGITFSSQFVTDNSLNVGGLSDFATESAILTYEIIDQVIHYDNAHWRHGFVQSSFSSQPFHAKNDLAEEVNAGEFSKWLVIPASSLPKNTKFLRIALAAYYSDKDADKIFNMAPTTSSTHPLHTTISKTVMDYETDPFIVYKPWVTWINDPFWLSHYAYAMKSEIRPYGINILARRGPVENENYRNTGKPYKGFWYGPLYLDWDLILGNENIYWLLGWMTGVFELNDNRWRFMQQGDTYGNTVLAPPSHYFLKNFAYLSYWLNFQYSIYNPIGKYYRETKNVNDFPSRMQQPLGLSLTIIGTGQIPKIFEIADLQPVSLPWSSSSLSAPLIDNPLYPLWLATFPALFGQARLTSAQDLYSSLFYLQERINHTMLDIGIWVAEFLGSEPERQCTASIDIFGKDPNIEDESTLNSPTLGNFEKWSVLGDTLACWWNWYQNIPWARGQAFPKKTGIEPNNFTERIGWEKPVIAQPASYWDYFANTLTTAKNYRDNPNDSYNALQVVNAPHTIFMSTSHYPLGVVQIAVKRK